MIKLAAESGVIDSVMHQVNVANHFYGARNDALLTCRKLGVGVVEMKPLVGGEQLKVGKKVKIAVYKTGWKSMAVNVSQISNSTRLLSYTLSQPGVCIAVTGVSSFKELNENLLYLKASGEERDYSKVIESMQRQDY